ncbi:MAG TPA: NAD(P)/FAD-dependent oxidoreductase [Anaerolineaceae bacterium]|nr:NAD(P)/FAD-dependent oxidoreductase [Anaerolineaceae bacterium]
MIQTDVIIVGGGPGGAACAWRLRQHNVACLILDQAEFPRFKPCAGWITPEVLRDLELGPAEYPHSFTTFTSFQVAIQGLKFKLRTRQHAIRRYEFDDWQVRRAGVAVHAHTVKSILETGDGYEVDGEYCGKYLVGAGGTHCPVYRTLFKTDRTRPKESLIVAQEEEFPYPYTDERCQLWFLENHLPGYAWYVPKANGYLNVGVGGKAEQLRANSDTLKNHWNLLVEKLDRLGLVRGHEYKPSGHSYYLRHKLPELRRGNAFLVGDAAGLATLDMGEGISPAIKSGLMAADAIIHGMEYSVASIPRYSLGSLIRFGFG